MAEKKSMADIGTNKTEEQKEVSTPSREESKKLFGRWDINRATWAIFAVTFVYAVFAGLQWWTIKDQSNLIREQIESTKQQFHIENRAWITVDGVNRGEFQVGEKTQIQVIFINSGKTPAINMGGISHGGFLKIENFTPVCVDSDAIMNIAVLGPGDKNAFTDYTKRQLSKDDIDSLNNRSLRYYIWGYIYYDDIFGRKHLTEYCFVSRPDITDFNSCDCCNSID